jgi:hypothetical protein
VALALIITLIIDRSNDDVLNNSLFIILTH